MTTEVSDIARKLGGCVISIKSKCKKMNCINHNLYDPSVNGNSLQPCEYYLSFEEALWSGGDTGEKAIGYRATGPRII